LPNLDFEETFQCEFAKEKFVVRTQAIKFDENRISCPTPTRQIQSIDGLELRFNLSVVKYPSNVILHSIGEYRFWRNSIEIEDFHPKIVSIDVETVVRIRLNRKINEKISGIRLADVNCRVLNVTEEIFCRSDKSNSSKIGSIEIDFDDSMRISSKDSIAFQQSKIFSIEPTVIYQSSPIILHIFGENLLIGSSQAIFFGDFQCFHLKQRTTTNFTCEFSANSVGTYNLTLFIDQKSIENTNGFTLRVKSKPIIEDIYPLASFARFFH